MNENENAASTVSDAEILACLRHLYADDQSAAMGAGDDLRTARAILAKYAAPATVRDRALEEAALLSERFPNQYMHSTQGEIHVADVLPVHIAKAIRALKSATPSGDAGLLDKGQEVVAWLVQSKTGMVRCAWTDEPTQEQRMVCEFDGDIITPLYTHPAPLAAQPTIREPLTVAQPAQDDREAVEIVGYRVSLPSEPELGHWFDEEAEAEPQMQKHEALMTVAQHDRIVAAIASMGSKRGEQS